MNPAAQKENLTPERLMQFAWAYAAPLMIEAALHHHVFDLLDKEPLTLEQLSGKTGASARGLKAVLNALIPLQLLARDTGGRYTLTPESAAFLVSGKPGFQGGIFRHISAQLLPKWLPLSEIVRTGKPAVGLNDPGEMAAFFEKFVEDIFPMSYAAAKRLGEALGLAAATAPVRVLDLAAGSGVWGIALAQQSPRVSVTAVDLKGVLPVTQRVVARHGLADRFQYIAGDLLEADFGAGYQIATLGHILHSEGEQRSRELLKKTFAALAPSGTIAIAEFLCNDDRTGPANAMIFAVNMLVNTDRGDTFTFPEIGGWLKDAGFVDARTLESPGPSPLILATRPAR